MQKAKILLVDDHQVVRDGMRFAIKQQSDMEVVGEAENGPEALKLAAALKPDLIVMDLRLGEASGIDVTREVLAVSPGSQIVILSAYPDSEYVNEAVQAGVRGYVLKSNASLEILEAIRTVLDGKFYLTNEIAGLVMENYRKMLAAQGAPPKPALSEREVDVLRLLAEGLRLKEIANRLNISAKTVESHRANLLKKLRCESTVALARYAIQEGISPLHLPPPT